MKNLEIGKFYRVQTCPDHIRVELLSPAYYAGKVIVRWPDKTIATLYECDLIAHDPAPPVKIDAVDAVAYELCAAFLPSGCPCKNANKTACSWRASAIRAIELGAKPPPAPERPMEIWVNVYPNGISAFRYKKNADATAGSTVTARLFREVKP
jgi:hypothetical protein